MHTKYSTSKIFWQRNAKKLFKVTPGNKKKIAMLVQFTCEIEAMQCCTDSSGKRSRGNHHETKMKQK